MEGCLGNASRLFVEKHPTPQLEVEQSPNAVGVVAMQAPVFVEQLTQGLFLEQPTIECSWRQHHSRDVVELGTP